MEVFKVSHIASRCVDLKEMTVVLEESCMLSRGSPCLPSQDPVYYIIVACNSRYHHVLFLPFFFFSFLFAALVDL